MGSVFTVFVWLMGMTIALGLMAVLVREYRLVTRYERATLDALQAERRFLHLVEDDIARAEFWAEADALIESGVR